MRLQNQDIWVVYSRLIELSKMTLPLETSLQIAKLLKILEKPYAEIEEKRKQLVWRFGKRNKKTNQIEVEKTMGSFDVALGEYLLEYYNQDILFETVKLPRRISATCDTCGGHLDIAFLIDSDMLMPLLDFVELDEE